MVAAWSPVVPGSAMYLSGACSKKVARATSLPKFADRGRKIAWLSEKITI